MLMHPRRRERLGEPRTCSTSRQARPTCGGCDRGDLEAAPERRSRRLPCESGAEHLENGTSSKIYLDKEECEHGKKLQF